MSLVRLDYERSHADAVQILKSKTITGDEDHVYNAVCRVILQSMGNVLVLNKIPQKFPNWQRYPNSQCVRVFKEMKKLSDTLIDLTMHLESYSPLKTVEFALDCVDEMFRKFDMEDGDMRASQITLHLARLRGSLRVLNGPSRMENAVDFFSVSALTFTLIWLAYNLIHNDFYETMSLTQAKRPLYQADCAMQVLEEMLETRKKNFLKEQQLKPQRVSLSVLIYLAISRDPEVASIFFSEMDETQKTLLQKNLSPQQKNRVETLLTKRKKRQEDIYSVQNTVSSARYKSFLRAVQDALLFKGQNSEAWIFSFSRGQLQMIKKYDPVFFSSIFSIKNDETEENVLDEIVCSDLGKFRLEGMTSEEIVQLFKSSQTNSRLKTFILMLKALSDEKKSEIITATRFFQFAFLQFYFLQSKEQSTITKDLQKILEEDDTRFFFFYT